MTQSLVTSAFSARQSREATPLTRTPGRLLVSDPDRKWREPVTERLKFLVEKLEPGWDGYNGRPVSLLNAWFTLRMLEATCGDTAPTPQIVPGSAGDVQIEWHTATTDIELHVRAPNDVHAWRGKHGDEAEGEELFLENDFLRVSEWVAELAEVLIAPRTAAA